jgi:peptide methionine sulfoxide reductase MsrB
MKYIKNIITPVQRDHTRAYWNEFNEGAYVNWGSDGHLYESKSNHIDKRLTIDAMHPAWHIIQEIVDRDFPNGTIRLWSAYQRQSLPHTFHVDDFGKETLHHRYTYIIALDTVPEFKAILFKEIALDCLAVEGMVLDFWHNKDKYPKKSNISESEDCEHTPNNNGEYWCDYLTPDGIFQYTECDGVLFRADQLHFTSNWIKHDKFPYRELLQIHVLSEYPVET